MLDKDDQMHVTYTNQTGVMRTIKADQHPYSNTITGEIFQFYIVINTLHPECPTQNFPVKGNAPKNA